MTHIAESFVNGWDAQRNRVPLDHNPYSRLLQSRSRDLWDEGWSARAGALLANGDLPLDNLDAKGQVSARALAVRARDSFVIALDASNNLVEAARGTDADAISPERDYARAILVKEIRMGDVIMPRDIDQDLIKDIIRWAFISGVEAVCAMDVIMTYNAIRSVLSNGAGA